jgi:uncharacterized protein (TIGR03435 family)
MAYGLQTFQIVGGPDWIGSDRFDIVAKGEGELRPSPPGGPPGPLLVMLQALLAERFKLATHTDTREQQIYALMLARSGGRLGPKLSPTDGDCSTLPPPGSPGRPPGPPSPPRAGERPRCGMFMGMGRIAAGGVTMSQLAMTLSQRVNRVVRDSTGLAGWYEFEIEFTPEQMPAFSQGGPQPGGPPPPSPDAPSIFTALQEQLGLKLEARRGPVDVLVIDSVERPTPD